MRDMYPPQWLFAAAVALLVTGAYASSPVQECPNGTTQVLYIADTSNLCAFWKCLAGVAEIAACQAGVRLPSYYTSGYDQPCTIVTTTCLRCNCSLDVPPPPPTDDQIDFCWLVGDCSEGCTCMNTPWDYQCVCPVQMTAPPTIAPQPPSGVCLSNPCHNGGTCNEVWEDFFCQCVPPWTGKTCDIDFCHPNPCHNGGTCFSTNITFWCVCPPCFAEPCCAIGSQSCACNDSCTLPTAPTCYDYKGTAGEDLHKCGCPRCKLGPYCNITSNACACNNDCSSLSNCVDTTDASGNPSHKCVCKPCWTGPGCSQRVQSCACNNDCLQGSTCVDQADLTGRLSHRCVCPPCRTGPTCQEYDYSTCACNPCNSSIYKVCEDADFGSGLPRICRNTVSSTGSVYTVVFQENNVEQDTLFLPLELYVSSSDDDNQDRYVTVSAPLGGCGGFSSINQIVKPKTVGRFTVPLCMRCDGTGFCNKALRVEETRGLAITLYSLNRMQFSADGALHLPDEKAGTDFFAVAYKPTIATQIAVVALNDNTQVSIRFSHDANQLGADADGIQRITMNKNQVYQVQGLRTSGALIGTDLTGSYVHADKPVNVFSGSIRDYAPRSDPLFNNDAKSRDHLVEQLPPAQSWGNQFAFVPIANRAVGDIVRVVAPSVVPDVINVYSSATAGVAFSFATPLPQNAPFVEFHARSDAVFYIESQQPIMVAQLTLSKDGSDGTMYLNGDEFVHDPSLILIHGIDLYSNNYAMSTPMYSGGLTSSQGTRPYNTTQLMLVADAAVRNGILLNDISVNLYAFVRPWTLVPAQGKNLYACAISLRHGTTVIRHPDSNARFGCWVYGYDDRESYGFPCGLSLAKRNSL